MILSKINGHNIKLTVKDTQESIEENSVELILNINIFREFILNLLLLNEYNKKNNLKLTDRERTILKFIVDGKTNDEIAEELNISIHTAKAHVHNLFMKISVKDRNHAIVKALKNNWVDF